MAELRLTDEEKASKLFSDWSDDALGKLVRYHLAFLDRKADEQFNGAMDVAATLALMLHLKEADKDMLRVETKDSAGAKFQLTIVRDKYSDS